LIVSRVCGDFADVVGEAGSSDASHRERAEFDSYSYRYRISHENSKDLVVRPISLTGTSWRMTAPC
jgi:hypothetical protein